MPAVVRFRPGGAAAAGVAASKAGGVGKMKQLLAVLGTVAFAADAAFAYGQQPDKAVESAIVQNERALYDAIAKADKAAFQSLTLPEGVWTTPSSFVPMGPLAGGLASFELSGWGIDNPHVVWTDRDSALLLYVRTGGGSFDHRPFAPLMLASTLWTKRGGKWVAVHHQESDVRQ
jgi:hypothetical protein